MVTLPTTLGVGDTLTITVRFTPTAEGTRTGNLTIASNDPDSPTLLPLTGQGVGEAPVETLSILSTSGNQIVDENGDYVRLKSINWFGAEGSNHTPHGTWARSYTSIIDQIKAMGFNCIRMPFSGDFSNTALTTSGINTDLNPPLVGLTALEVFDAIFDYCEEKKIYVVLDHHRRSSGVGADGSPVDGTYTETDWHDTWEVMATRYGDHPAVIGADLHNEPHDLTWADWADYAEGCAAVINAIAPDWLIMVEGVGSYDSVSYWWGGQLAGVADRPIEIPQTNKLVYSPHEYGQSVATGQSWLSYDGGSTPALWPNNLYEKWDSVWGFIYFNKIAPIWIGEFGGHFGYNGDGTDFTKPYRSEERQWLASLITYVNGDQNGDGTTSITSDNETGMSFAYWSFNPNSGDTGGLIEDDWTTAQTGKLTLLEPLLEFVPDPALPVIFIDDDGASFIDDDGALLEDN